MKKSLIILGTVFTLTITFALPVFAHETTVFRIHNKLYRFVIGSLNEPAVVDERSGVDLSVSELDEIYAHKGTPLEGLEDLFMVQVGIGNSTRKVLNLFPLYGEAGRYKAVYYPTGKGVYSYRIFGTLNRESIDFTTSCQLAGHAKKEEDTRLVTVSQNVVRVRKSGSFICPIDKKALGYPSLSPTLASLEKVAAEREQRMNARSTVALLVALIAVGLSCRASRRT